MYVCMYVWISAFSKIISFALNFKHFELTECTYVLVGITKVPTGDQPEDVEEQIRRMCLGEILAYYHYSCPYHSYDTSTSTTATITYSNKDKLIRSRID